MGTKQETQSDRYWIDPALILADAGLPADPWQQRLLRSHAGRILLNCSRQSGKSTAAAAIALLTAMLEPPSLVLLLSPTLRQSGELFRDKVIRTYDALGPVAQAVRQTQLQLDFANGSRIVSLPGNEGGVRGFSGVSLLVIDEASRVPDELYAAVRPMLAVSKGRLIAASTPAGRRGFFFESWHNESQPWERYRVDASECPRITPEFLAEERQEVGEAFLQQEYFCQFTDAAGAVFAYADVMTALEPQVAARPFPE